MKKKTAFTIWALANSTTLKANYAKYIRNLALNHDILMNDNTTTLIDYMESEWMRIPQVKRNTYKIVAKFHIDPIDAHSIASYIVEERSMLYNMYFAGIKMIFSEKEGLDAEYNEWSRVYNHYRNKLLSNFKDHFGTDDIIAEIFKSIVLVNVSDYYTNDPYTIYEELFNF